MAKLERDRSILHLEILHCINYMKSHGNGSGDGNLQGRIEEEVQISTGIKDESYLQDERSAPGHERRTLKREKWKGDTVLGRNEMRCEGETTRAGRNTE